MWQLYINFVFIGNERSVILRGAAKQLSEAIAQIKAKIEKENKTKILLNDDLTANKIRPTVESSSNDSVSISNNTLETSETFLPQGIHNYIHKTTLFSQNVNRFFNSNSSKEY